jgi:dihydropteroate synthase
MQLRLRSRSLDLSTPVVMGILNVTPDSFSDGGRYALRDAAVARGREMSAEGAALIDVGGESTRPGALPVELGVELERVLPVVEALSGMTISVDTSKPQVMIAAAAAGAELINDVYALRAPGALEAAADSGCAVCLMHMQGEPRTMQLNPVYDDVVEEVYAFLAGRIEACARAGIATERLLADPGIGFGKTLDHNLCLLRHLERFAGLGVPLLVGVSRKGLIGAITGREVNERLAGSLALAAIAVEKGARVLRAHDVRQTLDAVRMAAALAGAGAWAAPQGPPAR